jgi:hypothetical protein
LLEVPGVLELPQAAATVTSAASAATNHVEPGFRFIESPPGAGRVSRSNRTDAQILPLTRS